SLHGHKDRIDLPQELLVVALEHPAILRLVIWMEYSQAPGGLRWTLFLPPNVIVNSRAVTLHLPQIVSIENQLLVFGKEHAAEYRFRLAAHISVEDVNDVEIP